MLNPIVIKKMAQSILASLSLFSFIFHTWPWYTTPIVVNWLQSHIITNLTIVTHLCYSAMAPCLQCCRSVTGSLHKHLPVCPLNIIFLAKRSSKRVTQTSLKRKALRQVINTSGLAASPSKNLIFWYVQSLMSLPLTLHVISL